MPTAPQMLVRVVRGRQVADLREDGAIGPGGYQRESPFGDDPLTALEVSLLRLNHRQQLITGRPDEVVRNCRQIHDPIFLRRSPRNELEFAEFITAFARLVYDGTNGVTSVADRGAVKPTLPKWCYRDHRSVIVHVIVLRNHYLHGLSPNATTAEEHLTSAGDVFELYVAKRLPDDDDFAAIRVGMLTNLMSPLIERREYVTTYLTLATTFVATDPALLQRAREFEAQGMRPLDALHLASAERGRAESFVTCDDRILKRARQGRLGTRLTIGTPIEFVATRKKTNGES